MSIHRRARLLAATAVAACSLVAVDAAPRELPAPFAGRAVANAADPRAGETRTKPRKKPVPTPRPTPRPKATAAPTPKPTAAPTQLPGAPSPATSTPGPTDASGPGSPNDGGATSPPTTGTGASDAPPATGGGGQATGGTSGGPAGGSPASAGSGSGSGTSGAPGDGGTGAPGDGGTGAPGDAPGGDGSAVGDGTGPGAPARSDGRLNLDPGRALVGAFQRVPPTGLFAAAILAGCTAALWVAFAARRRRAAAAPSAAAPSGSGGTMSAHGHPSHVETSSDLLVAALYRPPDLAGADDSGALPLPLPGRTTVSRRRPAWLERLDAANGEAEQLPH